MSNLERFCSLERALLSVRALRVMGKCTSCHLFLFVLRSISITVADNLEHK